MCSAREREPLLQSNGNPHVNINTADEEITIRDGTKPSEAPGTTTTLGAVFIVVNAAMGAGLLNMPFAFSNAGGIVPAIAMQLTFLVFIFISLLILAYLSHIYNRTTYQEVIEVVCGRYIGALTEVCIILYMFGTCIAMIIIVGDQFDKVMEAIFGSSFCHRFYLSRKFTMSVFSIVVILPLCFPKDISFLKNSSVAGVISTLLVMLTVVVKYATSNSTPDFTPSGNTPWATAFAAVPAIFFAYQCHVSSVPIYATMKNKSLGNWTIVLCVSIALCAVSYIITGICGYLNFGMAVSSDILESYDAKDWWVIVARVAIVTAMLTTYPILHFCGRAAFFTVTNKLCKKNENRNQPHASKCSEIPRYIFTIVWLGATLALALLIPNIGDAIAVVGGLAGCFILVFPGLAVCKYLMDEFTNFTPFAYFMLLIGILLMVGGVFLFGEITAKAIIDDISAESTEAKNCYSTL